MVATAGATVALLVLSQLDVIEDQDVGKAVLAVLALFCIVIAKTRQDQADAVDLAPKVDGIGDQLAVIEDMLAVSDEVRMVPATKIGAWFAAAWQATATWRFKGGAGTYLRAQTLPRLAMRSGLTATVYAEILPPDDVEVSTEYSRHRHRGAGPSHDDGDAWTLETVRTEAYATIVAAVWYSQHTAVTVDVALMGTMTTLRHDMCDTAVLVTNERRDARALSFENRGTGGFFRSSQRELEASFRQARHLRLDDVMLPRDEITGDDVRRALREIADLEDDDGFLTGEVCDRIALLAMSEEHASALKVARGGARDHYRG